MLKFIRKLISEFIQFFVAVLILLCFIYSCGNKNDANIPADAKTEQYSTKPVSFDIATDNETDSIDAYFKNLCKNSLFNGCILVADSGKVKYMAANGYLSFDKKDTLTLNSSFQLASVSKQFTSAAILLLAQRNKLSLTDSIQQFFPNFPYKNINVHLLLSHRAGLGKYNYFCENYTDRITPISCMDVVSIITRHQPEIYYPPDSRFDYSNTGYALLAAIVEKVSGQSFTSFLDDNFFEPLGMNHTFAYALGSTPPDSMEIATGHNFNNTESLRMYQDGVLGDKGIYSSVKDLFIWDRALYSGKVIDTTWLKKSFVPYSNDKKDGRNYGYGWRLRQIDSTKVVYHAGWWRGFNSIFVRIPRTESTIIMLVNKRNKSFLRTYPKLLHIIQPEIFLSDEDDTEYDI